jgi:hypothetical protein
MFHVKIIATADITKLEDEVNEFLKTVANKFVNDVKLVESYENYFIALITYSDKVK